MGGSWLQTTKRRDGSAGAIASRSAGRDASILRWSSGSCACRFARSIVGFLILDYTPQAQDLFTEFADSYVRIAVFLVLLTTVWAGTTHYAARLLLDTDMRFRAYADPRVWTYLGSFERWVPRLLGLIPFAVVLIASERSIFNLPHIEDKDVIAAITYRLRIFDALVVAVAAAFLVYMVKRRDLMATGLVQRAEAKVSIVNRAVAAARAGWRRPKNRWWSIQKPAGARTAAPLHRFPALRCGYHLRCGPNG